MKNVLLVIFLFIFFPLLSSEKYNLSICTIFRDDAKYLPEWIEFHLRQGVEHFYLYDNLSNDNPKEILKPFSDNITLIDWPYESIGGQDFFQIQCNSYLHCARNFSSKWIAFLDTDEFLFCPDGRDIKDLLRGLENYGSVSAYWRMYGTSNVVIPEGGKLTEYLIYRANDMNVANSIIKSIGQTKYITNITNPHYFLLNENKQNIVLDVGSLRINHYWTRDLDFFYKKKIPRRLKWYPKDNQIAEEKLLNEVFDPILSNDIFSNNN